MLAQLIISHLVAAITPACIFLQEAMNSQLEQSCTENLCSQACVDTIQAFVSEEGATNIFNVCKPTEFEASYFVGNLRRIYELNAQQCESNISFELTEENLTAQLLALWQAAQSSLSKTEMSPVNEITANPTITTTSVQETVKNANPTITDMENKPPRNSANAESNILALIGMLLEMLL
jgi:hypothetical protein